MAVAKWMTTDFLLGWFRENKILDELFGASKQVQLVRRSADLLRFYTKYGQLTMEDMAIIWDCAYNSHEIFAEAVFKVGLSGKMAGRGVALRLLGVRERSYPESHPRSFRLIFLVLLIRSSLCPDTRHSARRRCLGR